MTSICVGSADHSDDASAMRRAVIIAVPDGASIFWSWCSSMISAVSKNGAASSANRIIEHRADGEVGRDDAVARGEQMAQLVELGLAETGRAHDRVHLVHRAPAQVAHRRRRPR